MEEGAWKGAWNTTDEIRGDRRGYLKCPPAWCGNWGVIAGAFFIWRVRTIVCCFPFEQFPYPLKLGTSCKNNQTQYAMSKNAQIFIRAARFLEAWIVVYKCFGWAVLRLSLGGDRVDRGFLITIVSVSAWEIIFGLTGFSFWLFLDAHICSFVFDFWPPLPFTYTQGLSQFLALLSFICNSFDLSFAQTKTSFSFEAEPERR